MFEAEEASLCISASEPSFEIKEILGEGGMGVVYLAEQKFPKRDVAVKRMRPSFQKWTKTLYRDDT